MTMTPECEKAYSAWLADPCRYAAGGFGFEYAWNAALKWRDAQTGSAVTPDPEPKCEPPPFQIYDPIGGAPKFGDYLRERATLLTADDVRRIVREELQAIGQSLPDLPPGT